MWNRRSYGGALRSSACTGPTQRPRTGAAPKRKASYPDLSRNRTLRRCLGTSSFSACRIATRALPAVHRTVELAVHRQVRTVVWVLLGELFVDIDAEPRLVARIE